MAMKKIASLILGLGILFGASFANCSALPPLEILVREQCAQMSKDIDLY